LVGFAKDDGELGILRELVDDLHTASDVVHLLIQAHLYITFDSSRLALGMVGDEIERDVVGRTMRQELLQERA
jgi:hypothetical protein